MGREWKPGVVAMVRGVVCMYLGQHRGWEHGRSDAFSYHAQPDDVSPLVVIDPEDREQVERLWKAWRDLAPNHRLAQDNMQAALREFANPTLLKPEEPQGLGAVVEDADGDLWIRTDSPAEAERNYNKPWWQNGMRRNWQIVDAVRVLSEGVTA